MAETMNIAALARRTRVPAHTLRKWEERYGVLHPRRTPGGQRRYGEVDVARIEWLRDRLSEGYRIGEAALLLGTGDTVTARTPRELRDAIFGALVRTETEDLDALLDHAFAVHPLPEALAETIAPLLGRIGEAWAVGEISVAQEHLLSACVRARLERLLADQRGAVRGIAVLCCAPGELHDIGLLMLAALLRADGWSVAYLGASTPIADAVSFAGRVGARVLALSVCMEDRRAVLEAELPECERPAGLEVLLGGAAATPELARRLGARHGGRDLRSAVARLRKVAA